MESKFEEEDGGTAKRIKLSVDDHSPAIEVCAQSPQHVGPGLLDLSDDVMLIIFAFLSPADLINLSQSCARLWHVTRDRTLWYHVDCRDSLLDSESFEADYLDYLLPTTRYLAVDFRLRAHRGRKKGGGGRSKLRADAHSQGALAAGLLRQIASVCVGLDTLILQDVCFDAQQIPFGQFPPTLSHLSLKNSDVQNLPVRVSYFNDIHRIMPNLQVLILSHSLWLESHSLMAISKCAKLRELRLQGCYALGDCIAYFSIATRFGFKDLETLDLRGTQVGDPEVSCLNLVPSLRHLYLESITQYARRRDAEYYMNRVRQYPDITIVPHPDSGPVQNPVILLQRIAGEMVARNVTSEFHSFGRPRAPAPPVGTSTGPAPSAFMRRLRERWQIPDRRLAGATGPPPRSRPVIVVPMKRPRVPPGPEDDDYEQYNALEDALRLRGVITLIHDNIFSGSSSAPAVDRPSSSGLVPSPGSSKCRKTGPVRAMGPGEAGPSSSRGGESGWVNGEERRDAEAGPSGERREVKVEEGRVTVHLNNNNDNNNGDPLVDYREYLTRYIQEDSSSRRLQGERKDDGGGGGDDSSAGEEVDGGPCCSYVGASTPGCSKYGDRRATVETPMPGEGRKRSFVGDSDSDDPSDEEGGEGEDDLPPAAGSPLHFCTIGRARFSGLTVPFFHRLAQVTDACLHAVCGGAGVGAGAGPVGRLPRLAYDIATLRAEPRDPSQECRLQTLVLRHYPKITDQSLYVLSKLASLRYLDVTGTSVTACGIKNFRLMRPDVEVSSDHDLPAEP